MDEQLHLDLKAMKSLPYFGDLLEHAVLCVNSEKIELAIHRNAKDRIGRHWYGLRVQVTDKSTGQMFYLYIGLIYLPSTRQGLMVEVDRKNNIAHYEWLFSKIESQDSFDVNQDEKDYLKLFMPEKQFSMLSQLSADRQVAMLSEFIRNSCEAITAYAAEDGFRLTIKQLLDSYRLANAFETVLSTIQSPLFTVKVNDEDPDNFGKYAEGFRYYLSSSDGEEAMYAYFGAIYSYQKLPSGIFSEIDRLSNPEVFDRVKANMTPSHSYDISLTEPDFIKLFLPLKIQETFNINSYEKQMMILSDFLTACNVAFITAAKHKND